MTWDPFKAFCQASPTSSAHGLPTLGSTSRPGNSCAGLHPACRSAPKPTRDAFRSGCTFRRTAASETRGPETVLAKRTPNGRHGLLSQHGEKSSTNRMSSGCTQRIGVLRSSFTSKFPVVFLFHPCFCNLIQAVPPPLVSLCELTMIKPVASVLGASSSQMGPDECQSSSDDSAASPPVVSSVLQGPRSPTQLQKASSICSDRKLPSWCSKGLSQERMHGEHIPDAAWSDSTQGLRAELGLGGKRLDVFISNLAFGGKLHHGHLCLASDYISSVTP